MTGERSFRYDRRGNRIPRWTSDTDIVYLPYPSLARLCCIKRQANRISNGQHEGYGGAGEGIRIVTRRDKA